MTVPEESNPDDGPPVGRRGFLGALGGASLSYLGTPRSATADPETAPELQFVEAALEFELLDDAVTPGTTAGPPRYDVRRGGDVLVALDRLDAAAHETLVTADAAVFGLGSLRAGPATFAASSLDVLPVAGAATPRRTRSVRLAEWPGAPAYRVESGSGDAAVVRVEDRRVDVPAGAAVTSRLEPREIRAERVPGYRSTGLEVVPHLDVRNYGTVVVRDTARQTR